MYSLIYLSTATNDLTALEIEEICSQATKKNIENNISGILIYNKGSFLQVLESQLEDKDNVDRLYDKIACDSRHYDLIKLYTRINDSRSFSTYNSFATINDQSKHRELYKFLKIEKFHNPKEYNRVAHLTQKFLSLI